MLHWVGDTCVLTMILSPEPDSTPEGMEVKLSSRLGEFSELWNTSFNLVLDARNASWATTTHQGSQKSCPICRGQEEETEVLKVLS